MSQPRPIVDLTEPCACGAVELRLNGPVLSMLLCSCLACQKATGTGHATVALVNAASLTLSGTPASFARPADSGALLTQHFCAGCGTPLFAVSSRAPDLRLIPVGLFAGNANWYVPGLLIFARSHQEWDTLPPDLPRHETYPPG
jgi:hypothetical protein